MLDPRTERVLILLSLVIALAVLVAAGTGVVAPGIYLPMTPARLIPGAVSQDVLSLLAALGLLVCVALAPSRWPPARLIWLGLIGYLFYAYALYAFEGTYNVLYLVYVLIAGAAVYALILFFSGLKTAKIGYRTGRIPPRRSLAALFAALVVLFLGLWLSILVPAMITHVAPDGGTIFVLDLGFVLPLLVIESVLLWRRAPFGDVLALPLVIKVGTLGLSVLLGTLFAPLFGFGLALEEVAVYAVLGFGPLVFVPLFLKGLRVG